MILEFDQWLFLLLNGLHNPILDDLMVAISNRWVWIPLYAILFYFLLREFGVKSIYILIAVGVLITLSDQLALHMIKNTIQRLRPCHDPDIANKVHLVHGYCGGRFGFLSSHASNAFALAVFLGNLLKSKSKYWLIGLLSWAAIVAYSRVYLGAHYPLDILAGAIFGALLAFFIRYLLSVADKRFALNIFAS